MSQQELLAKVVSALNQVGIDYMVTGSLVSSLQGEPRSTHDIDFVISAAPEIVGALVEAFPPPDYYLDRESVTEAVSRREMFNLIDVKSGDKADFWILTDEPFDRSRFARKYEENVLGMTLKVSSPEDTILAKLRWAALSGGSEKQFIDALRVYEVQSGKLDMEHLEKWANELGVQSYLQRIKNEAVEL